MTDQPQAAARQPIPPVRPMAPMADSPPSARESPRARRPHPLLGAFPLAVMTLATFLVLFTLMMARLQTGAGPVLSASKGSAALAEGNNESVVTTRTSGGGASSAPATSVAASEGTAGTSPAVVTRASGALGAAEGGDD